MKTKNMIAAILGSAAIASGAMSLSLERAHAKEPRALGVNARIPFADSIGIRNYQADGDEALWIEDQRGDWYRAEILGPCTDLPYANGIGFITRGTGTLDKFGQILVRGRTCQLNKLVTSAPPPSKKDKARIKAGAETDKSADKPVETF